MPAGARPATKIRSYLRASKFFDVGRRAFIAVTVPMKFSLQSGHLRSSLKRKAVDRSGRPIPWYSYPAIQFLSTLDFSDASVLEFGGGQSSIWWSERAKELLVLEHDEEWFTYLKSQIADRDNVECVLKTDKVELAQWPKGRSFDVVVVDGGNRILSAETAAEIVSDRGLVIVDNSEFPWGRTGETGWPIIELLESKGFMRVDLYGYAPGTRKQHCTSLCFKDGARVLQGIPAPRTDAQLWSLLASSG